MSRSEMLGRELPIGHARSIAETALVAYGAQREHASQVAAHLIANDLLGVPSHGIMRIPEYSDGLHAGLTNGNPLVRLEHVRTGIVVHGDRGLGVVVADAAVAAAVSTARRGGFSVVSVRDSSHLGRIGAHTEAIARRGFLSMAFVSGAPSGHHVAPFGGVGGRLGTNPISYSFPLLRDTMTADFATSAVSEGTVRTWYENGEPALEGVLLDETGQPTRDPGVLYREPTGSIMPLGGPDFGYKGTALAILAEALATLLPGEECDDPNRGNNNMTLITIAVARDFAERAERLAAYLRSAAPPNLPATIVLPGDKERQPMVRSGTTIRISAVTGQAIASAFERVGMAVPSALAGRTERSR